MRYGAIEMTAIIIINTRWLLQSMHSECLSFRGSSSVVGQKDRELECVMTNQDRHFQELFE